MRKTMLIGFGLAAALASTTAHAQEFGEAGDVSFAADRLMGLYIFDYGRLDFTTFSLGADTEVHPFADARLGIDFFVIDQLSLGGTLAFWFWSDDTPRGNDNSAFMVYPRIGYAIPFSDAFGFWPRGGLTFIGGDIDDEVALTFEATFFAIPVEHFGFNFGPTLDVGVAGDGPDATSIGIVAAGLFGWL